MSKADLIEKLAEMTRPEIMDLIKTLNKTLKTPIKMNGKDPELREKIKAALEAPDAEGTITPETKPTVKPADKPDTKPAEKKETPKSEKGPGPKKVGKEVKGRIIAVANVKEGALEYQVLSVQADLPGCGVLRMIGKGKQGDFIKVPMSVQAVS